MGSLIIRWGLPIAGIVFLLAFFLPVGVRICYRQGTLSLWLNLGPLRLPLNIKNKKRTNGEKKQQSTIRSPQKESPKSKGQYDSPLGDFMAKLQIVLELFGYLSPKLCIKLIMMRLHLAGKNPAVVALQYGGAWAAIGAVIPLLEEAFIVKKRDLDVDCDFDGELTTLDAELTISIPLGRLLWCLFRYGIHVITNSDSTHFERR
jgi:hypothetical protein